MMNRFIFALVCVLVFGGCGRKAESPSGQAAPQPAKARITLSGAFALYPMAVRWADEYQKLHPEVRIDISAGGAGKGMADALSGAVDLGMVSRDVNDAEKEKGAWWVSVVKDAVLPTFNAANPLGDSLMKRGMTIEEFRDIWVTEKTKSWPPFPGQSSQALHVYTRSDACGAAETWAKYLGGSQEDLKGTGVFGDPGLAEAVRKDPLAIGFNNLNFAYDSKTGKPIKGIRVLPIDINGNGTIEESEAFYGTQNEAAKAIADGRYPSPPARALHLVSLGVPKRPEVAQFLRWVLTDGQKYVLDSGYINLPDEQLQQDLKKLE